MSTTTIPNNEKCDKQKHGISKSSEKLNMTDQVPSKAWIRNIGAGTTKTLPKMSSRPRSKTFISTETYSDSKQMLHKAHSANVIAVTPTPGQRNIMENTATSVTTSKIFRLLAENQPEKLNKDDVKVEMDDFEIIIRSPLEVETNHFDESSYENNNMTDIDESSSYENSNMTVIDLTKNTLQTATRSVSSPSLDASVEFVADYKNLFNSTTVSTTFARIDKVSNDLRHMFQKEST